VAVPGGPTQLSAAKAAALQGVQTALDAMQSAQQNGNFAEYGQALQNLDESIDNSVIQEHAEKIKQKANQ
jgi:uncharacterized membrane protein (UPF0182 family)